MYAFHPFIFHIIERVNRYFLIWFRIINIRYGWKIVQMNGNWSFLTEKHLLMVKFGKEEINNLIIFAGHDWENETETILFTGLDSQGRSVWGKRIK